MPLYSYVARNPQGKTVSGKLEAANQSSVVKTLREQGLIPTSIQTGAVAMGGRTVRKRRGKPRIGDKVIFSRQMATMIRAGLPLIEVLDILSEQSEKQSVCDIVKTVQKDVEAGASLTEAVQKHPRFFDTFFVSMIRTGEASGMLDAILDQIAIYLEKIASIQRKVKSALAYPIMVSIVATCITVFLLVKVVPVFEDIFADLGGDLPIPTKITLAVSAVIQHYWWLVLMMIVAGVIALSWWYKTPNGRYVIDSYKIRMPVFGQLFLKMAIARFARTFATLIRAGVNILLALEIVSRTAQNAVLERAIENTKISIQSGESLSRPLMDSGVFPPMVTRMIDVGERTGALESMLTKVAEFYEDQVDAAVAALTSMIEPLLIVFLGLVIGFIVISMFMPLFKMIELVSH
ncbi:MAG: type II secretion system F family protein [Candidatus Sumerlaeia bacterium]